MSKATAATLMVKGMTCQGCVNSVTRIVKRADPAAEVSVDLATGRVDATSTLPAAELAKAITAAGFETRVS